MWRTRLKKTLTETVGIIAKTSLPSSNRFTGIFCSSFSSKLKSELIKSSRNAPWTKSTDGLRDEKCPDVVLVSVTCQFKPIGSLRSSANDGNSNINSSRAGSLYLAPFFSLALGRGSRPNKWACSQATIARFSFASAGKCNSMGELFTSTGTSTGKGFDSTIKFT